MDMDIRKVEERLVAQRYYEPDTGYMSAVSLEELLDILDRDGDKGDMLQQFPFLLPETLDLPFMYRGNERGKSVVCELIETHAKKRTDFTLMVGDGFPKRFLAFLEDQVGRVLDSEGNSYHHGMKAPIEERVELGLRESFNFMAHLLKFDRDLADQVDFVLLCERDELNGKRVQDAASALAKEFRITGESQVVMPKQVAVIHWGREENRGALQDRMKELRGLLPRLIPQSRLRLWYAREDLTTYPPMAEQDILNVFACRLC